MSDCSILFYLAYELYLFLFGGFKKFTLLFQGIGELLRSLGLGILAPAGGVSSTSSTSVNTIFFSCNLLLETLFLFGLVSRVLCLLQKAATMHFGQ